MTTQVDWSKYESNAPQIDFTKYESAQPEQPAAPQPYGNAGNAQKPMITPLPGEDFADTMKRAATMGKTVTPQQIATARSAAIKQVPTVLGAAAAAGPAMLVSGAIAPAAASEAAGGGILGSAAGGAAGGAATSPLIQATQGQNPFSVDGAGRIAKDAAIGGVTGGVLGAAGKVASRAIEPFVGADGQLRVPSFITAGKNFDEVSKAVGAHPIEVTPELSKSLMNAKNFSQNGSSMPSPLSKLIDRLSDPEKPPLTYDDARQFYTNISKLTAADKMATNAPMKRYVTKVAIDLGNSISDVADRGGNLSLFQDAMRDYRSASQIEAAKDLLKEHFVKGAAAGAGAGLTGLLVKHAITSAADGK